MLFLSERESEDWTRWGKMVSGGRLTPEQTLPGIRPPLRPVFCFFAGTGLAVDGQMEEARRWLLAGTFNESPGLMMNAYLLAFLERHDWRLDPPATVFADPRPYIHFTNVPAMRSSREAFRQFCCRTLPAVDHPFRLLDIGCGDGELTVTTLRQLRDAGLFSAIGEVALVDASQGMLDMAARKVRTAFPDVPVRLVQDRIENVSEGVESGYDLALCSLSYHHMPRETKLRHLRIMAGRFEHLVLFELDANNDAPEGRSPELALSVYQSYGRLTDVIFAHDTDIANAQNSVDCFVMVELLSFLRDPRASRSDFHMLRSEWHDLFQVGLGPDYRRRGETTCHADPFMDLFALHYGRG